MYGLCVGNLLISTLQDRDLQRSMRSGSRRSCCSANKNHDPHPGADGNVSPYFYPDFYQVKSA